MFGLVSKKKVLKVVERCQKSNKHTFRKDLDESTNAYRQGYEDGNDNCANAIKGLLRKRG